MVYLPTFTIKINQMSVNMPYVDSMGFKHTLQKQFWMEIFSQISVIYSSVEVRLWKAVKKHGEHAQVPMDGLPFKFQAPWKHHGPAHRD